MDTKHTKATLQNSEGCNIIGPIFNHLLNLPKLLGTLCPKPGTKIKPSKKMQNNIPKVE